jgi:hypothetical protein
MGRQDSHALVTRFLANMTLDDIAPPIHVRELDGGTEELRLKRVSEFTDSGDSLIQRFGMGDARFRP